MKFTQEQNKTWELLFSRQLANINRNACEEYLEGFKKLALPHSNIPSLFDLNEKITLASGWTVFRTKIRYLTDLEWSNSMEKKMFPITNYMRSRSELDFTPEPDMFHDIFGHLPLLMNREVADLIELFSHAYIKADKDNIKTIAQLWWFTVEFGLIQENGKIKAFGAGLMSSFGEMNNVMSRRVSKKPFSVKKILNKQRAVNSFHNELFVIKSVSDLRGELQIFFNSL